MQIMPYLEPDPWDQQEGEEDWIYEIFYNYYLPQPPEDRVVARAYKAYLSGQRDLFLIPDKASSLVKENSLNFNWGDRAKAYDAYIKSLERKELAEKRKALMTAEEIDSFELLEVWKKIFEKYKDKLDDPNFKLDFSESKVFEQIVAIRGKLSEQQRKAYGLDEFTMKYMSIDDSDKRIEVVWVDSD